MMKRATLVCAVGLTLALGGGCGQKTEAAAQPQPPAGEAWLSDQQMKDAHIQVAPVVEEDVGGVIPASGKITFDDLRVSHVFSPVTGRVTKILAQPGQRVKRGTPLVVIQSPDVGTAFSDLAKAHADLVAAEHDYKRAEELYKEHAGSAKDYEIAQDNFGKAKAEMERAQKKARLLRSGSVDTVSQEYTLPAPIDGEVIARAVNPGVEVQGLYSGGTAVELFTIGEIDKVWVIADVFEQDLAQIKNGAPVTVKVVAYPSKIFRGKVEWVSDALDPTSRTAKVRCSIPNPERELKPEMYATVSLSVAEHKALAIPRPAILRLGEQTVVFVETGRTPSGLLKFERRAVAVEEDGGEDYLPVLHGLDAGDKIVVAGAILISGMI